jgi:hypothetical protein
MRRVQLLVLAAVLTAAMLATSAAPASAEWIQNPVSGEYWNCDYYSDGYYWYYVPSYAGWTRAVPGWQYLPGG